MKISIGNDHAGLKLKRVIKNHLETKGHIIYNYGSDIEESVDYADFVHPVAKDIEKGKANIGIVICGSGNGAAMTSNKHQKVRAALCWTTEITKLSREHNNANILSIPARFVTETLALEMIDIFISTEFEGGRHEKRIGKIPCS
tara:strand:- start:14 stop:445 length:432 start_codon:yes stop_codon:yes gene_type:complete